MIVPYRALPGSVQARPFLDVLVGPAPFRVAGLVDSGAVHGLFHPDVAAEADIDLSGAETRPIEIGPRRVLAEVRFLVVPLEYEGVTWEAELGFTESMTLDWGLLGQSALFRWFTIEFRTYDDEFELTPISA